MKRVFLPVCLCALLSMSAVYKFVIAEELKSDQYIISEPYLDFDPPKTVTDNTDIFSLLRNSAERNQFQDKGVIIRRIDKPVEGSIENAHIRPVEGKSSHLFQDTVEVSVRYGTGGKSAVTIGQVESLSSLSGSRIDGTRCDTMSDPCTRTQAKKWNNNSVVGVGYTMSGGSVPVDFANGLKYRNFPELYRNEQEGIVLIKDRNKTVSRGALTVRVRKSPADRTESYQAVVQMTVSSFY